MTGPASSTVSLVQTVEFVVLDGDPCDHWRETYDDSGLRIPNLAVEWRTLPGRFLAALEDLVDRSPDDPEKCWRCDSAVGYVDETRESTYGVEYEVTVWRLAALVAKPGDGPVSVQCEECCPDIPPPPVAF